ncbi:hypothetical protein KEH59_00380 (plasmid) [Burkholderia contaminans]|uniref:hypothetical protein n=1 Tax=Burkholderia contaminans TaxID=488447 RepID=UPI001BAAB511|nr:hypothetical protein [Burkholderia contaminans]QUN45135.1 hypothetical protein KEH59_00380 [Burkholderia contaminans]
MQEASFGRRRTANFERNEERIDVGDDQDEQKRRNECTQPVLIEVDAPKNIFGIGPRCVLQYRPIFFSTLVHQHLASTFIEIYSGVFIIPQGLQ